MQGAGNERPLPLYRPAWQAMTALVLFAQNMPGNELLGGRIP
jgi:hypothetical protein